MEGFYIYKSLRHLIIFIYFAIKRASGGIGTRLTRTPLVRAGRIFETRRGKNGTHYDDKND